MNIIQFIVFSFATWRISSLLVNEEGPFLVFRRLRESVGIEHDENGNVYMVPGTFFAGILACVWCCSTWVAFGWIVFYFLFPEYALWTAMVFALSTGAILLDKMLGNQ